MDLKVVAMMFLATCFALDAAQAASTSLPESTPMETTPEPRPTEETTEEGETDPEPTEVFCPAGNRGTGGFCDCTQAAGGDEGTWRKPWCYEGQCYTGQDDDRCIGQNNGAPLGDGTWCWRGERNTACPATPVDDTSELKAKIVELEGKVAQLEQCAAAADLDCSTE